MTHTAAYELCLELYQLSSDGIAGWGENSDHVWRNNLSLDGINSKIEVREREFTPQGSELCPAYSAGDLLRKLEPLHPMVFKEKAGVISKDETWVAALKNDDGLGLAFGDTSEDALAALAIDLFGSGVLSATKP